jgi:hypothetical protein
VGRPLLVPYEDVMDAGVEKGVVDGKDGASRIPEDVAHVLALESIPDDLGPGSSHKSLDSTDR